ncbi:sigma-70 family RNA polymerase sigma factor [Alcaligenes sp.]|uniref:sigma-70 family RNA polymerase sigma factor n=1 Tax=Alcaligenes sp. TaxID=512 RepID=UPI003D0473C8
MSSNSIETFEAALKPLWLQAQAGDEVAYGQALGMMAARLRAHLRRRLPGAQNDVEDIVQEVLLALHVQRGTYDPSVPVSAWCFAIARYKLVDYWRKHGRTGALHDVFDERALDSALVSEDPDATAKRDLEQLLNALPEAQRRAIELTKLQGLSVLEAAQTLGASESAVKVQVHRGLKKMMQIVRYRK